MIFYILYIICIIVAICLGFGTIFGVAFSYERDQENYIWKPVIILIITLIFSVSAWLSWVQFDILDCKSSIEGYKTYSSTYNRDTIVDTEIEMKYFESLKRLDFYKRAGLYKGE